MGKARRYAAIRSEVPPLRRAAAFGAAAAPGDVAFAALVGAGLEERRRAMFGPVAGPRVVAEHAAQHRVLRPGGVVQGLLPRPQLFGQRFGGARKAAIAGFHLFPLMVVGRLH